MALTGVFELFEFYEFCSWSIISLWFCYEYLYQVLEMNWREPSLRVSHIYYLVFLLYDVRLLIYTSIPPAISFIKYKGSSRNLESPRNAPSTLSHTICKLDCRRGSSVRSSSRRLEGPAGRVVDCAVISKRPLTISILGRPSFLQDTTLHIHNSTHTTQHGTTLYGHNSTPHNATRSQLDIAQLNTPQLDTPWFDTSHLDTTQLYTTTTRHTTTLHGHNSTRHNSTQTIWP